MWNILICTYKCITNRIGLGFSIFNYDIYLINGFVLFDWHGGYTRIQNVYLIISKSVTAQRSSNAGNPNLLPSNHRILNKFIGLSN